MSIFIRSCEVSEAREVEEGRSRRKWRIVIPLQLQSEDITTIERIGNQKKTKYFNVYLKKTILMTDLPSKL